MDSQGGAAPVGAAAGGTEGSLSPHGDSTSTAAYSPSTPKPSFTQLPSLSSDSVPLHSLYRPPPPSTLFSASASASSSASASVPRAPHTAPTSPLLASPTHSDTAASATTSLHFPPASSLLSPEMYTNPFTHGLGFALQDPIPAFQPSPLHYHPSASSSSLPATTQHPSTSATGAPPEPTTGGTKEAWKRRKQVLLAEAHDHTLANLQLHGLRPPPNTYHPYYLSSSILANQSLAANQDIAPTRRDNAAAANQATFASTRTAILRPDDPKLRNDIIRIIDQWLADEGFGATRQVLMDEAGIKQRERDEASLDARKLRSCLLEGDWPEVDKLLSKPLVKNHKAFLYAVYKQQFLEHVEHREFQKAFTFLNKRLKPLEHYQPHSSEFRDLCYLLSAKAVTDAPSFASWEGIQPAREKLVMEFAAMLEQDRLEHDAGMPGSGIGPVNGADIDTLSGADDGISGNDAVSNSSSSARDAGANGSAGGVGGNGPGSGAGGSRSKGGGGEGPSSSTGGSGYVYVPPRRLMTMLHQAVAYQVEFARYHPKKAPVVSSLLHDYTGFVVPNSVLHTMRGHRKNVKSVRFVGEEGRKLVSGSSDNTVRLWDTNTGRCEAVLEGHRSRVWDVDSTRSASHVTSASGDSTVKVWDAQTGECRTTLRAGVGDVYSCRMHPDERHLIAGGYDRLVRMYDVETGSIVKTFTGHQLGVTSAILNPLGNLIITSSKDTTIRFWDLVSGLCIRTITGHLGEVTSIEMNESGSLLLSSSKDNSNRLWDVRMLRPLKRFKGHQNTSKNFIRASFAHTSLLVGGSEDGRIYMWDQESSEVLQTLEGHAEHVPWAVNAAAYGATWNKAQSLLASCGDDGTVKTWVWDERRDQTLEKR